MTHRPCSQRRSRFWFTAMAAATCLVLVAAPAAGAETTTVLAQAATLDQVLTNLRNWIMGMLALLASVFVTIGGVRYLIANGDPGEIEKAKQSFKNSAFGFALAALAPMVVEILRGIVGV